MSNDKRTGAPVSFPIKPPGPPKVWRVVDVVIKDKGSKPIRFSIQEIPEDRYEDVVEHMLKYFIADEPMCKCYDGRDDPEFKETFRKIWTEVLSHGLALGAFVENPDGGKPIIAGVNALVLSYEGENYDIIDSMPLKPRRIMEFMTKVSKDAKVYERYGVDRYISAFGLSVDPSFRGASLGGHLLRAREDVGREYNLSVTSTVFTSPISQKLAERNGFETLYQERYEDVVDDDGNELFPGIGVEFVKVMAKKLF